MFRQLIKTDTIACGEKQIPVSYFEIRSVRGVRRFLAEILLGPDDYVFLDDGSNKNLEVRANQLVPAAIYSRILAKNGHDLP
jgi:hypothetical protein